MPLTNLEPKHLWGHFDEIRKIPRPSKHEEQIREHVIAFARVRKLDFSVDDTGNIVVRVPATPGHEAAPAVVIQAHMDMVCEKNNDVEFDFMKDPIQLEREGDWLTARGTTLGADNGVGMAAGMALVDDPDVVHGPLELLITVDEETGLTGAAQLDAGMLQGKRLLNLDTEELGALYIGCSGGGDSHITLPVTMVEAPPDAKGLTVKVVGLRGGHSGMDIIEQRGNAIKVLARLLWKAGRACQLNLAAIEGGGKHNAIPREATAHCVVRGEDLDAIAKVIADEASNISVELGKADPRLKVEASPSSAPGQVMDTAGTDAVINMLMALPHGVDAMSLDVPGLVETSNNLATISTEGGSVLVSTSTRSSIDSALQGLRDRIHAAARLAGASVEEENAYPGWKPDLDSEVLAITRKTHEEVFGETPELKAVHAGLECGIIGEKIPGMDMVSFGPAIEHPHSPDERVNIPSVETFWTLLKAVVKALA